jgi:hypothetical protein
LLREEFGRRTGFSSQKLAARGGFFGAKAASVEPPIRAVWRCRFMVSRPPARAGNFAAALAFMELGDGMRGFFRERLDFAGGF